MTTQRARSTARFLSAAIAVLTYASSAAGQVGSDSESSETPYGGVLHVPSIQRVPATFNFQARITQAKMGLEDAELDLTVELQTSSYTICGETFEKVRIRDSVLNLTIGTQCDLDIYLAQYRDVSLRVCINGGNCLEPIPLGSVPFAIKSNVAVQAHHASRSDFAARAFIANRLSADRQLAARDGGQGIGVGYYELYTPPDTDSPPTQQLYDDSDPDRGELFADYEPYKDDGYIQWAPVSTPSAKAGLHVCAMDVLSAQMVDLEKFWVHAKKTYLRGDLRVAGGSLSFGNGERSDTAINSWNDDAGSDASSDARSGHRSGDSISTLELRADVTEVSGELFVYGGNREPGRIRLDDPVDGPQISGEFTDDGGASNTTLSLEATRTVVEGALSVAGEELLLAPPTDQSEARIRAQDSVNIAIEAPTTRISGNLQVEGTINLPNGAGVAASDLTCDRCVSGDEIDIKTLGLSVERKETDISTRQTEYGFEGEDQFRYIEALSLPCESWQVRTGGGCSCRALIPRGGGDCGPEGCAGTVSLDIEASYPVVQSEPYEKDRWRCVCDSKYREEPAVKRAVHAFAVCMSIDS